MRESDIWTQCRRRLRRALRHVCRETAGDEDMPWVNVAGSDPGRVDQAVRAAIHECWHALPAEHQHLEEVERVFRRLVDRVFRDLTDDAELFVMQAALADPDD